jgi:hypothetical protein
LEKIQKVIEREFKKGETYHVTSTRIDGSVGFAIFRPTRTQNESGDPKVQNSSHIIRCQGFSNMNNHWDEKNILFTRKSDGANTYPWSKSEGISVWNRPTRLATEQEKLILDYVIERGEALTPSEIRDIKINTILKL